MIKIFSSFCGEYEFKRNKAPFFESHLLGFHTVSTFSAFGLGKQQHCYNLVGAEVLPTEKEARQEIR